MHWADPVVRRRDFEVVAVRQAGFCLLRWRGEGWNVKRVEPFPLRNTATSPFRSQVPPQGHAPPRNTRDHVIVRLFHELHGSYAVVQTLCAMIGKVRAVIVDLLEVIEKE